MRFILTRVTETVFEENGKKLNGFVHDFAIKPNSSYNKIPIKAGIIQLLTLKRLAINIGDEYSLGK